MSEDLLVQKNVITLVLAKALVAAAEREIERRGWAMYVAIADDGGMPILVQSVNSAQLASFEISVGKARAAAHFRRPTKAFHDMVAAGGEGVRMLVMSGAVPIDGGLPIIVGGVVIGGIGISGGTSAQDGQVAAAGLAVLAN